MPRIAHVLFALLAVLTLSSPAAFAQQPRDARLIVTVVDQSGGVIPNATVTVVGLDETTKKRAVAPGKTSEKGVATFAGLPPGRYSVQGEFPGFDLGLLRDLRIKAGDSKHVVVLPLAKMATEVTVGRDAQTAASDRASTFGTALTREQMESLSDDPDEMRRQLQEMAGPGAAIRVDSFEGQQLPPKAQIKAIHITRDQFAAENHSAGGMFIDIITQPGMGPLRTNTNFGYYNSATDGQNPLIPKKGPAQNANVRVGLSGSLIKERSSFSISVGTSRNYSTPYQFTQTSAGRQAQNLDLRVPSDNLSFNGFLDYALTKDQTLRVSVNRYSTSTENQGAGGYNFAERAYSSESSMFSMRVQEAGPLGRRFFINTRFSLLWNNSSVHSVTEAPTIVVNDAFTSGGAQQRGGTYSRTFTLASDLDYVRGMHSVRMGVQMDGGRYRSDSSSNYLGTYVFESLAAYEAGLPRTYTKRTGDPTIAYWNVQAGVYLQDDIRVRKNLTFSPGVRVELQTHLPDYQNIGPRFGVTWSPFKSGKTSLRASAGVFYDWLSSGIYEQTIRVDGFHQQEMILGNPSYPETGIGGTIPPTNRYLFGNDLQMARNTRLSASFTQQVTKSFNVGATYSHTWAGGVLIGHNLNAPANGVRPDPAFANIIETVSQGRSLTRSLSTYASLYVSQPGMTPLTGPLFNWKRGLGISASYYLGKSENNTEGAFSVPASNNLSTEWGPSSGDMRHRASINLNTGVLRGLSASIGVSTFSGSPYTIRTGRDDNGDLIFNDRPVGVGRNSVRTAWRWNSSGYFSYTIGLGKQKVPSGPGIMISGGGLGGYTVGTMASQAMPRYRINIMLMMDNLTNHANYSGYSGLMTSPFFMQPTTVTGVRTMNLMVGFSF